MRSSERSGDPCDRRWRSPLKDASRSDTVLPQAVLRRRRQQSGALRFDMGLKSDWRGAQPYTDALPNDALPLPCPDT